MEGFGPIRGQIRYVQFLYHMTLEDINEFLQEMIGMSKKVCEFWKKKEQVSSLVPLSIR